MCGLDLENVCYKPIYGCQTELGVQRVMPRRTLTLYVNAYMCLKVTISHVRTCAGDVRIAWLPTTSIWLRRPLWVGQMIWETHAVDPHRSRIPFGRAAILSHLVTRVYMTIELINFALQSVVVHTDSYTYSRHSRQANTSRLPIPNTHSHTTHQS